MTVRELLARTDSRELSEWMAYEQVTGPIGGARGDYQAALVAWTVANSNRTKDAPAIKVADFLPDWDPQPQSDDEMEAIARQLNRMFGGTEG